MNRILALCLFGSLHAIAADFEVTASDATAETSADASKCECAAQCAADLRKLTDDVKSAESVEAMLEKTIAELDTTKSSLQASTEAQNQMKAKLEEATESKGASASEVTTLRAKVTELESSLEASKKEATEAQGSLNGINAQVKELEVSGLKAQAKVKELEASLEASNKAATETKGASASEIATLQAKVKELEASNKAATEAKGASASDIATLQTKVKELEASNKAATEAKGASASEIATLQAKVKELEVSLKASNKAATDAAKGASADAEDAKFKTEQVKAKVTELKASLQAEKAAATQATKKAAAEAKEASASLKAKVQELEVALEASTTKLNKAESVLAASDVQAFITARTATLDGVAAMQENAAHYSAEASKYTAEAYVAASKHTADAYVVASKHTADAYIVASKHTAEAYDMVNNVTADAIKTATAHYHEKAVPALADAYEKAVPVLKDTHKTLAPHIETAKGHFFWTVDFLTTKLQNGMTGAATHVPAIAPHVEAHGSIASKVGAYAILLLPLASVGLLIYFAVIRRMSRLLLKLEYASLFLLLGMVGCVSALALTTKKDPIALLREASFEKYMLAHYVVGAIGAALAVIQCSCLLSKANSVKGTMGQCLSFVAAGLSSALVGHYYTFAYKKAMEDPAFTMPFQMKDDRASFVLYTAGTAALVLVSALATPASFRFSSRAILMALEGIVAGVAFALWTLEVVVPDPVGTLLMKEMYAPHVAAGFLSLLGLVLVFRFLTSITLVTFAHAVVVAATLRPVVEIPYQNLVKGSADVLPSAAILTCGMRLLALLALQVLLQVYAAPPRDTHPRAAKMSKKENAAAKNKKKN